MLQNRYVIGGVIILVLLVANIINWIFSDWGLITVHAKEVPLAQVIKSIERQGHVTIYSDVDSAATVTMDVVKVPLAEAMESLIVNINMPPPPDNGGGANGGGGAPGGRPRGGFGGGAQWGLAFFTAPSSAKVQEEIRAFQAGSVDNDDTKIYSYPTPLQMLASDDGMPAADPRLQKWPGYKAPPAPPPSTDGGQDGQQQASDSTPDAPSTVQDYLDAMAREADIWIMSPDTWNTKVSNPPGPSDSIAHAVRSLVSSAHGSVEEAIVLRGRGRPGGGGRRGGRGFTDDTGWSVMADRMSNAINGLPEDARPAALDQLKQESDFHKVLQAAPPDQRRGLMRQHFMNRMGQNNWRRSPEKRAQMYQRAVSNRQSARGGA